MSTPRSFAPRTWVLVSALVLAACSGQATSGRTSGPPTVGQTPVPSSAPPSAQASAVPRATAHPTLTGSFTSNVHGISIRYPAGWVPRAATQAWPEGEIVLQGSEFGDVIEDGSASDTAFLALASRPLDGADFDAWAASYLAIESCATSEPITVDGYAGLTGPDCTLALVEAGGRGYLIWLYRIDDVDWFREILATVDLDPAGAKD